MSRGIDYAGPASTANRDAETGIRYGVIPMNAVTSEWAFEEIDSEYDPSCPHCGAELPTDFETGHGENAMPCPECGAGIEDGDQWGDEPSRNVLAGSEGEQGFLDDDNDLWVTSSPYYTRAAFCSPCAPGACYLTSPCEDGERAYCLGPEWFEGGAAPYPVYRVDTDERVAP